MASASVVQLVLRASGGSEVKSEVGSASRSISNLRVAAMGAGTAVKTVGGTLSNDLSRGMRSVTYNSRYAALGVAGLGGAAVKMGLDFNSSMEQNQVAFTHFLGSSKEAKVYLGQLFDLAAKTPFQMTDVVQGSRTLIGFGMSAKGAMTTLKGLANAISATGASADSVQRATLALGQIQSRGKLASQDFYQLTSAGVTGAKQMGDAFHESSAKFMADMQAGKISSASFFKHLNYSWRNSPMYAGAAAAQSKTFQGQLSTLHDYASKTLGTITKPLFDDLRTSLLPEATKAAQDVSDIFSGKNMSQGQKFTAAWKVTKRDLGPFVKSFEQSLKDAHIDDRLADVFNWAAPKLGTAAMSAAPKVAGAFVTGWLHLGPWEKLFSAALLAKHFGVFRAGGSTAAGLFASKFSTAAPAEIERRSGKMSKGLNATGVVLGKALGGAMAYEMAHQVAMNVPALSQYSGSKGWGELWRDIKDDAQLQPNKSENARAAMLHPRIADIPSRAPARPASPSIAPHDRLPTVMPAFTFKTPLVVQTKLDGKVLTESMSKIMLDVRERDRR